jgi:hypothetical protein
MRRHQHQRGTATLWVLFSLVPIFGMTGLVTDVGWYYFTTEEARAAAESASLAAVQSAMDSVKAGGSYSCGSRTLACQSTATGCATTVPSPITSNLQDGCAYAIANGFKNTGSQTVTIQANTTSPPPTVSGVTVTYWVTVRITQSNPLTFLGVFGGSNLGIGVRSTAAVIPASISDCVIALDPSASQAISASGSARITANNCAIAAASSSSDALDVSGSASISGTAVDLVGGSHTSGSASINPTPTTVTSVSNPYSSLATPSFSTTCDYTNYQVIGGSATINPGT